ncbi:MAG: plasmid stabilization protein ParE [Hyphomicrobiales bacterium]|nr:MAG: plasmid stabilization protein ParE [Hyphomicrobiales bacterium]
MALRLTKQAEQDLDDIYVEGASNFGTRQAERYSDGLDACLELLANFPAMAPERTDIIEPVRVHPHGSHLVVYEIEGKDVLVLRILHQHSNWERSL